MRKCVVVIVFLVLWGWPGLVRELWSQEQASQTGGEENQEGGISLNFQNVQIGTFLQAMSDALQVALVWDENKVKGNITVLSPNPFERVTASEVFESVLSMQGYAIVQHPSAPLLQVVPVSEATRSASGVRGRGLAKGKQGGAPSFHHTEIIQLRYADVSLVANLLRPLVVNSTSVGFYKPANVLMLTESAAHLERLRKVVRQLDVPSSKASFKSFKLRYAEAQKLAPILRILGLSMLQARGIVVPDKKSTGSASRTIEIQADVRTNSLLILAGKDVLNGLEKIINELDTPPTPSQRGLRVFRLEHSNAEELVKIFKSVDLKSLTSQQQKSTQQIKLSITADKATNSLVVFGTNEAVDAVANMLIELDVRPPQVFVEVLIMEMSLEKSLDIGVNWRVLEETTDGIIGGTFPSGVPATTGGAIGAGSNALIGVLGNEITYGGETYASFSGFIRALQQDQDVNIIANPQVLTINNKEAEINVSSVIPISTRTVTNTQSQSTTEFEFRDVGVILKITPQITSGNRVRLVIRQEFSSVAGLPDTTGQTAITTLKRSINTEVVVDDQSTMAIGGLIQTQSVETVNRVPFFSRIWILGNLFKSKRQEIRKTNLLAFIRPSIINSLNDANNNTRRQQERYDKANESLQGLEEQIRRDFLPPANKPDSSSEEPSPQNPPPPRRSPDEEDEEGNILSDELIGLDFSNIALPKPNLPPEEMLALENLRQQQQSPGLQARNPRRRRNP